MSRKVLVVDDESRNEKTGKGFSHQKEFPGTGSW